MTDRTVAEVMGWQARHDFTDGGLTCLWCDTYIYDTQQLGGGTCPDNPVGPTPDDMLSWLREQGYDIEIGTAHDATEVGVEISRWDDWHEHTVADDYYASTLHAALEAAVLAVSAAQDVEQQGDDGEHDQNGGQHG